MPLHPEELRLARSLRELIHGLGTTEEDVAGRLGWEADRLRTLLAGQQKWLLEEVFQVLQTIEVAPGELFGRVYDLTRNSKTLGLSPEDRRFEESQEVVQEAVARRCSWKRECAES